MNETCYAALQLGNQALQDLGLHPFKARQLTAAFDNIETRSREEFYNDAYLRLFMEIDQLIHKTMQKDRADGHSRVEHGWTPPPGARPDANTQLQSGTGDPA